MNSTELLDLFRVEMSDRAPPYLWSDSLVYSYLDDAQKQFCRLTNGIADARTEAVTQIDVVPGTEWYVLHPSIRKIRSVSRADTGAPVDAVNAEHMSQRGIVFGGQTGPVRAVVQGLDAQALRVWPIPNETVTLNLSVFRLPLVKITDDGDQNFEIGDEHSYHLLLWVKSLAYNNQDAETFDRRRSDEFAIRFREYCAEAKAEQDRARRVGTSVAYGGI